MKRLSEIFDTWYGVNLELINCDVTPTGIPFIARGSTGNGMVARVAHIDGIKPNPAHTLSLAGGGSVLSCFYQEEEYYSGRDLFILSPKDSMTKNEMLLYSYIIETNKYKYSYGRQANRTFRDILLPELEEVRSVSANEVNTEFTFKEKPKTDKHLSLSDREWEWFEIGDRRLFRIEKGKRLTKADMIDGDIPYIGAIDSNNGVSAYISNDRYLHDANTITVSYNGSIAEAYYQGQPYWATDDVNVLYPMFQLNRYSALFLTTILHNEKYRFNYGRKWKKELMERSKIKLPVNADGNPDWQFMEDYIKSLPYSSNI